jgi:beta-glucuronidase
MDFVEWNEYYESWYGGTVESVKRNLEEIHRAFPDKMIVVSEYGYCECTPDRVAGDPRRIEILRRHTDAYRECDWVGGAIFFCYNDYRTHIGDKGIGALKQRVHGVVDLYGGRKPSFAALRAESSPVETLDVHVRNSEIDVVVNTRKRLPAYRLDGYRVRCIACGFQDLPMEQQEKVLPATAPGGQSQVSFTLVEKNARRVRVDILRPNGSSVITTETRG